MEVRENDRVTISVQTPDFALMTVRCVKDSNLKCPLLFSLSLSSQTTSSKSKSGVSEEMFETYNNNGKDTPIRIVLL